MIKNPLDTALEKRLDYLKLPYLKENCRPFAAEGTVTLLVSMATASCLTPLDLRKIAIGGARTREKGGVFQPMLLLRSRTVSG
jgi:hypothetical protein